MTIKNFTYGSEKIIKEKEIVHEDEHKDYASKGVGNAA